jgi:hypothetical protein
VNGTTLALVGLLLVAGGSPQTQEPPSADASDLVNVLLSSMLGLRDMTGDELQREVAEIGQLPFRSPVVFDYLDRRQLVAYLREVVDAEYPPSRAEADARTLVAFGLLDPGTDLRRLRTRLLEENVAGFYDDRPGKKRLYAISEDRRLTPANQMILAHELRHALQDQYMDTHGLLDDAIGDFDDRRMAVLSLLEGDATFLMARYLVSHAPGGNELGSAFSGASFPTPPVDGAPPVLRDQLVLPYTVGVDFVASLWKEGGWNAVRAAWSRPPQSTEQVLHPEKYRAGESPRPVLVTYSPRSGRLVNEGVLGEMFTRTLLGDEQGKGAEGWGGDAFRVWDLSGKTLLVWQSVWDGPASATDFARAMRAHLESVQRVPTRRGDYDVFSRGDWRWAFRGDAGGSTLVSSDDEGLLRDTLEALR